MYSVWLKPGLKQMIILLHQATVISMSLVRLVMAAVSQQYIVIFSMLLRKQDTGLTHSKYLCLMLHCQICKRNISYFLHWLLCIDRQGRQIFFKEFADFLSDLLVNVDKALIDKALIVGDFNIHVDNTNNALGLAFTDLINYFGVKQNVTGPTHRFNHTLDWIISHGIDLTDIDIISQSDDVTEHFLVSCMLHNNDFNYMAPRYQNYCSSH